MNQSVLVYSASSDRGSRKSNQDNLRISAAVPYVKMNKHYEISGSLDIDKLNIFCVCDGIGGACMGELAAKYALHGVSDYLGKLKEGCSGRINKILLEAAEAAQQSVTALYRRTRSVGGCTIAMLGIQSGRYAFLNIGDSAGFVCRNGKEMAEELGERHHLAWLKSTMGMEPEKADHHRLIHYLGKDNCGVADMAYCCQGTLNTGDRVLLCSDGITEAMSNDEIGRRLRAGDTAEKFVKLASEADRSDNCTAVCLSMA